MPVNPTSELTPTFAPGLRADIHPIVPNPRVDAYPFPSLRADIDDDLFPTIELRMSNFTLITILRPKYFNPQQLVLVMFLSPISELTTNYLLSNSHTVFPNEIIYHSKVQVLPRKPFPKKPHNISPNGKTSFSMPAKAC